MSTKQKMKHIQLRFLAPLIMVGALLVQLSTTLHAQAFGVNLLTNPGFEAPNLAGWNPIYSSAIQRPYGWTNLPSTNVSLSIGGGGLMVVDSGGDAVIEQTVALTSASVGANILASGFFGGGHGDASRLVLIFKDSSGNTMLQHALPYVDDTSRNRETVLMLRETYIGIPAGATQVVARIVLDNSNGYSRGAAADNITLMLMPATIPLTPPAHPTNTELLSNPGFENGWANGSPLELTNPHGWIGIGPGTVVVKPYSNANVNVPNTNVSSSIGGSGNMLSDGSGFGSLRQRIDLRGHSAFSNLRLRVSAFLGGYAGDSDNARVDVRFLRANFSSIASLLVVGPVTNSNRNRETVLLKRTQDFLIPSTTEYVEIDVAFDNNNGYGRFGILDNISAMLVASSPILPVPLNVNLLHNSSFEVGTLANSPLQLTNADGWFGTTTPSVVTVPYGSTPDVPAVAFASNPSRSLGGHVLRDNTGFGTLRQEVDLSGSAALISAGRLRVAASAWLGGKGNDSDSAKVEIRFMTATGAQIGGTAVPGLQILGPVTAAMRLNLTTLIEQTGDFQIPSGAVRMSFELIFDNSNGYDRLGLADKLNVTVYDTGSTTYPGTGEDLTLELGVNGPPAPSIGSGVVPVNAGDVVTLNMLSPNGTFDFSPLWLTANVFPTGTSPTQVFNPTAFRLPAGLTGLYFEPLVTPIILGNSCLNLGCPLVLPGGLTYGFQIPAGYSGQSVILQMTIGLSATSTPANGWFASTDAYELQL